MSENSHNLESYTSMFRFACRCTDAYREDLAIAFNLTYASIGLLTT